MYDRIMTRIYHQQVKLKIFNIYENLTVEMLYYELVVIIFAKLLSESVNESP